MLNVIIIHGRLVRDPETKQTPSGVSVCRFTVAVDRSFSKGEDKQTDFFSCVAWRAIAEIVSKYFAKGKEIVLTGQMQSRKWQDDGGATRTAWEILVQSVDFCGSKSTNGSAVAHVNDAEVPPVKDDFEAVSESDDLPF